MASSTYRLFGAAPQQSSVNLYPTGTLPQYNSGFGLPQSIGGGSLIAGVTPAGGGLGSFQPSSNAFRQIQAPQFASATIKSPAQGARIGQSYGQYDLNRNADQASLTDFTKQYVGSNPQAQQNTTQEQNAIGGFYNGGVQGDLNSLADRSLSASNLAAQRALGQAGRQSALYRMQNGNSSYADAQLNDQFSNIAIQNALRDAQQRQQNYLTVLAGQQGNLGVRNKLQDNYLNRLLVPGQQANLLLNNQLGTLGALGGLDLSNTSYGAPQQPYHPQANPAMNNLMAQGLAANDAYWSHHVGTPQANYVLPHTTTYGPINAPPFPVVPTFDSYGRPQAQPFTPLTSVPEYNPLQAGATIQPQYNPDPNILNYPRQPQLYPPQLPLGPQQIPLR